jgi:hypothetical protein
LAVAEDFKIVMGAAGFVTGHVPQAAVDGLPLESTAGSLRFRDDVPSREVSRAGALLEAGYGVENGGSAARAAGQRAVESMSSVSAMVVVQVIVVGRLARCGVVSLMGRPRRRLGC